MSYINLINLILYMPLIIVLSSVINIQFKFINIILISILSFIFLHKKRLRYTIMLVCCIFIFGIQVFAQKINVNIDYLLSFISFFMLSTYFSYEENLNQLKDQLKRNLNKIFYINSLLILLIIISFISGHGWMSVWGKKQFIFTLGFPHDACYFFTGLEAYFIVIYHITTDKVKIKFSKFSIIVLFIFSLLTNARTPFAISMFLTAYFFYKISKNKFRFIAISLWFIVFILLSNILFGFINIEYIPIVNKFVRGFEMQNVTSSRDLIWENLMMHYNKDYNIKDMIIGMGFGISNYFNKISLNLNLWSHNDFIEIIMSVGISGMIMYLYSYHRINKVTQNIMFTSVLILVAYWNGLYVYSTMTLFIPCLILATKQIKYN